MNLANATTTTTPKAISSSRTPGRRRRICADPPSDIASSSKVYETKSNRSDSKSPPSKKLRKIRDLHCARLKGSVSLCMKRSTGEYVVLKCVNKRIPPFGRECVFLDVYVVVSLSLSLSHTHTHTHTGTMPCLDRRLPAVWEPRRYRS